MAKKNKNPFVKLGSKKPTIHEGIDFCAKIPSLQNLKSEDIAIKVEHLTKNYGKGKGIFDISFVVPKGKVFGYCGTNGAGKTTTLRHIMGFLKPDSGHAEVYGLNCWKKSTEIKKYMGYLPGEIAFPAFETGTEFLNFQAEMLGVTDMSKAEKIINSLQLDPTANLKRMSKGMKQKTALVAAFMHSPDIILLDEPTTGLDPLMRESFIEIIKEEKDRGATIIMSNHMFDELEECCDYVGFIKDGYLVDVVDLNAMHDRPFREFVITFDSPEALKKIKKDYFTVLSMDEERCSMVVQIKNEEINDSFKELNKYQVLLIKERQYTLEKYFMDNVIGGMTNDGFKSVH